MPLAEVKMKTTQSGTRLGSEEKAGTQKIRRFQLKHARQKEPRQVYRLSTAV